MMVKRYSTVLVLLGLTVGVLAMTWQLYGLRTELLSKERAIDGYKGQLEAKEREVKRLIQELEKIKASEAMIPHDTKNQPRRLGRAMEGLPCSLVRFGPVTPS